MVVRNLECARAGGPPRPPQERATGEEREAQQRWIEGDGEERVRACGGFGFETTNTFSPHVRIILLLSPLDL
ncbi:hypothetical protein GW17_00047697 [Ensete ventricosum]|nr:hypothetical protein GW17_00047697 [Ensete ventricosum]RZS21976.1 hypothetical protein BHM03_00054690 [Ensete ventricosum]